MLTIFSCPKPFVGNAALHQRNALASWKMLMPRVDVILVGNDSGVAEACAEFGFVQAPHVRLTRHGTPLLSDIFYQAEQIAKHDLLCYANCDIIFTPALPAALASLDMQRTIVLGRRRNLFVEEALDFGGNGYERLAELFAAKGELSTPFARDYFVFLKGSMGRLPDFAVGRPRWDDWFVASALQRRYRVVDATDDIPAYHPCHNYGHIPERRGADWSGPEADENYVIAWRELQVTHLPSIEDATHILRNGKLAKNPNRPIRKRTFTHMRILHPRFARVISAIRLKFCFRLQDRGSRKGVLGVFAGPSHDRRGKHRVIRNLSTEAVKRANLEGYRKAAAEYDAAMAFHRNDIEIERQRIIGLLGNWRVQEKNICQTAILEIGVGTGISRLVLSALLPNATYFPTDISRPMLVEYRRKYSSASPIVCDAEKLPFKNESFELIVCCSLIHHLPGDRELLLDTHRALKRGGIFLGMREPKRAGCDFWFRFHHLAKRYGDRRGMRLLAKRILGAAGGWRAIWRTELSGEEFIALDAMEIRGAILRPTPTKKRGGIDSRALGIEARRVFGNATVVPFGCCTSFIGFFTILFQKRMPHSLLMIAYRIDRILLRMGFGRIFDSFSVSCRKQ